MRNFVQHGRTVTIPAAAAVASGDGVLIGSIFGVANGDAAIGEPVDLDMEGVFDLPKVSALAIAVGDTVYFDSATGLITKTSAGNRKVGLAVAASADPSPTARVRLVPSV